MFTRTTIKFYHYLQQQISVQTWQSCRQITSHFPLSIGILLIESGIRHTPYPWAYTSRRAVHKELVGDLLVRYYWDLYSKIRLVRFKFVRRRSGDNLVVVWSRRVGNSARLPARARTARGGYGWRQRTLFGPFRCARACSRHRSQQLSDNKNSTIDTTSAIT